MNSSSYLIFNVSLLLAAAKNSGQQSIRQATGQFADAYAHENLFDPLKIEGTYWQTFKKNGYPLCSGALWLKPRDMAKIGLLVLNKGKWQNQQIVTAAWIEASTRAQIATGIDADQYGYHWWISTLQTGDTSTPLIWANGLGSQFIFILPQHQIVLVTTGGNWAGGNQGRSWDILKIFEQYLPELIK